MDGALHYRGPVPSDLLPELKAHSEDIADELRWRGNAPVKSGRLSLQARQ